MTDRPREESDQLPEEGPPDQIVEDTPERVREGARESAGGADGREGRSTGHPQESEERERPD